MIHTDIPVQQQTAEIPAQQNTNKAIKIASGAVIGKDIIKALADASLSALFLTDLVKNMGYWWKPGADIVIQNCVMYTQLAQVSAIALQRSLRFIAQKLDANNPELKVSACSYIIAASEMLSSTAKAGMIFALCNNTNAACGLLITSGMLDLLGSIVGPLNGGAIADKFDDGLSGAGQICIGVTEIGLADTANLGSSMELTNNAFFVTKIAGLTLATVASTLNAALGCIDIAGYAKSMWRSGSIFFKQGTQTDAEQPALPKTSFSQALSSDHDYATVLKI